MVWGLFFGPQDNLLQFLKKKEKKKKDTVSLMDTKVRHTRRRFTHLNSIRRSASLASRLPGYAEHGAIWPAAWPLDTSTNAPSPSSAPDAHLPGLEERWRRTVFFFFRNWSKLLQL